MRIRTRLPAPTPEVQAARTHVGAWAVELRWLFRTCSLASLSVNEPRLGRRHRRTPSSGQLSGRPRRSHLHSHGVGIARGFGFEAVTVRTTDDLAPERVSGDRNKPLLIDRKITSGPSWWLEEAFRGH